LLCAPQRSCSRAGRRLTDLPYQIETAEQVAASIATLLVDAKLLHFQEQQLMQTNAVWFLCEGRRTADSELATFLVFRGTMSPTDAIADVMFRPEAGPNGVRCHGGFLRTLKEDAVLHAQLKQHLLGGVSSMPLYVMGHSLGGALSQTLVVAGFLPPAFDAPVTIVSLGGPAAIYGAIPSGTLVGAAASARCISIVNGNDVVPRLLGSKLSFTRKLLSLLAASSNPRKQRANEATIDTLE